MPKRRSTGLCVYCGINPATEREDVLAKQFFPPEERYRGKLVKVPACGTCNREKQKVEDAPGIIFQFSDASPASEAVLKERVPATLRNNARLAKALRQGFGQQWVRLESGLLVKRLVIQLAPKDLYYINEWYQFLTKGFYYHEFKEIFPRNHSIYLLKPTDFVQFCLYRDFILRTKSHRSRSLADGEFKYIVASNDEESLTMWMFVFRSVEMCSVTVSPECPAGFRGALYRIAWKERSPTTGST